MDARLVPSELSGEVRAPPSKSYTHRALLGAGLSHGARIRAPLRSADTEATARAVEAFGGEVTWAETDSTVVARIDGVAGQPGVPSDVIDCANSGTTMRLATAIAGVPDGMTVLTGDESLRQRPQGPLLDAIEQLGGRAESTRRTGTAPLVIEGPISGGEVAIPGDVSSQFVTALLVAGALTPDGISIELTTPLKSAPYVDVTLEVLDAFGVSASATDSGYRVQGRQTFDPGEEYEVPGDFSSISYLLAGGAVAAPDGVRIRGATPSAQGDTAIVDVVREMGAPVEWDRSRNVLAVRQATLSGVTVGVSDTPDLLPTIAALGAVADGTTRITDCEHVRYKETDRVTVMAEELRSLGAAVDEDADELRIHGDQSQLTGGRVHGHGDHRIVMALAVAALAADGPTTITGAEHVTVSFPGFFDALRSLGADLQRRE